MLEKKKKLRHYRNNATSLNAPPGVAIVHVMKRQPGAFTMRPGNFRIIAKKGGVCSGLRSFSLEIAPRGVYSGLGVTSIIVKQYGTHKL